MSTPQTSKRTGGERELTSSKATGDDVTRLGLHSERSGQNEEKFLRDTYTKHGTKCPYTPACPLVDGAVDVPLTQSQPVPPAGLGAADRRTREQTVLKLRTSGVVRVTNIQHDTRREETQLHADVEDHCTSLLDTRPQTLCPTSSPSGETWITCSTVSQVKLVTKNTRTGSVAVSQWDATKVFDSHSLDSPVYFFKQEEVKRSTVLGPLAVRQQCHASLTKLNTKSYATVEVVEVAVETLAEPRF